MNTAEEHLAHAHDSDPLPRERRISWTEALAKAPWPVPGRDDEDAWRSEYATALVKAKLARARHVSANPGAGHRHPGRGLRIDDAEFGRQSKVARVLGLSWAGWAMGALVRERGREEKRAVQRKRVARKA